jgi:probable FeS assembly SUF system protein SufT
MMRKSTSETRTLRRPVDVVEIPAGTPAKLPKGMDVIVAQTLGGMYTVHTSDGRMVRIDGRDADAIGYEVTPELSAGEGELSEKSIQERVWDQLKTCYDPEIPVDIVELGLIYLCEVNQLFGGEYRVDIRMTLTAPGCGMGGVLKSDVERKVAAIPGVKEVVVDLVFDPPWDKDRMSEAARLQLGFL